MSLEAELKDLFGLDNVTYKADLSNKELFHESIANDRGRVKRDGPRDAQKSFATKLGDEGPQYAERLEGSDSAGGTVTGGDTVSDSLPTA